MNIDADRWRVLSPLLDEALELPAQERDAWLARLAARDRPLATDVERLLEAGRAADAERFLDEPAIAVPRATLAGQVLGAYTLEAPLGEGGMGSVWLARRSDGRYKGKVAIKFLNAALVGRVGEERFRREGSILARLAHPNIARLIDAGVSSAGQPYLVLELVEGERIDRYCDERKLDVPARLRLFLDVLAAVEHAHASLVVHRDLKPPNVLVARDATVKLLDFGIAKLIADAGEDAEATELTREAGRALTPEYSAPEQLLGEPITTATDVYALGVLLYVLLGGQHPAGVRTRSSVELVKAIVDDPAPRVSEAVGIAARLDPQTLHDNAARRATTPERLSHVLRGDLDNIVSKALKKLPGERYASATAFADDIRRHLEHEPISACADSLSYRAAKFVRRNRLPVALASAAIVALLAGLAGTLTQAERATRQAKVAEAERSRADSEARLATEQRDFALRQLARADAVNDFNAFLLADAAPSGKSFTAGELLSRAETIAERQHNDLDRVDTLITIGDQYRTLGETNDGRRVLTRAYELSRKVPDRITRAHAACSLALAEISAGEPDRAEALFREGLDALSSEPQYVSDRINCLLDGSMIATQASRPGDALERARSAQSLLPQLRYPSATTELRVAMELADSYRSVGDLPAAIAAFERVDAQMKRLGRENTLEAAIVDNNWAMALNFTGQMLQAERLFRRSMQIESADRSDGNVPPMVLTNLARVLIELDRIDEAQRYADRSYERGLAEGNEPVIRDSMLLRARIHARRGESAAATKMLDEVEARYRKTRPADCVCYSSLDYERAKLAAARGDADGALAGMDKAVGRAEHSTPDALRYFVLRRAEVELAVDRTDRARADAERAIALDRAALPSGMHSSYLGLAYLVDGRALLASGLSEDAARALASARDELALTLGADHPQTRLAERLIAQAASGKRS